MSKNKAYSFQVIVQEIDIDTLQHTNNISYLKWVLLAAENHWNQLTNTFFNEKYVWVVLKHEISYLQATKLNDEITIKTWIGNSYGVKSERFVEVYHKDVLCAKCLTTWCLMDKKSMKPVRINPDVMNILEG